MMVIVMMRNDSKHSFLQTGVGEGFGLEEIVYAPTRNFFSHTPRNFFSTSTSLHTDSCQSGFDTERFGGMAAGVVPENIKTVVRAYLEPCAVDYEFCGIRIVRDDSMPVGMVRWVL